MRYGTATIDLERDGSAEIERIVTAALLNELRGESFMAGATWAPDGTSRLSDGLRVLRVGVTRKRRDSPWRVHIIGTVHQSVFNDVPPPKRWLSPAVQAAVTLERGPIILGNHVRRRLLPQLNGLVLQTRERVAVEREWLDLVARASA